ncbi:trypsin-like serine peptidase [Bdellovibrio bacteriovorus]|uniref:Serine protease n=1 Tax=Bdellovibrio bacteriovorus str. Tiberius TaxID=1069642 RepID=K7YVC2_BDEBC|nr:serine protease [Bdellovibrio bacteriovorus]AFY00640.1 serine protease SplA [Bdellovibrio bacteriovorus str. Tiberius]
MNVWKAALAGALIMNLVGCGGGSAPSAFVNTDGTLTQGVIYGEDSIQEVSTHTRNTRANVALVHSDKWNEIMKGDAAWTVDEIYGTGQQLPWSDQESKAFCSGTLVAPKMVLTAGHCFTEDHTCENTVFVFNDEQKMEGATARKGWQCKQIVAQKNDFQSGLDYALVEVSMPKDEVEPVVMSTIASVVGDSVYSIGYPLGSLKKTAQGKVRSVNEMGSLETNLDVFVGNSGSPVFDSKTHDLIGILHGGEDDFQPESEDGSVQIMKCAEDGCKGEFVIPIQKIVADIEKQK